MHIITKKSIFQIGTNTQTETTKKEACIPFEKLFFSEYNFIESLRLKDERNLDTH